MNPKDSYIVVLSFFVEGFNDNFRSFLFFHASLRSLSLECTNKDQFYYFSTMTYVLGTQNNGVDEDVLLHTQNIC